MPDDNGDPYNPASAAYVGDREGSGARCKACGWEGNWEEVWVEVPDPAGKDRTVIGPDPGREHTDPPYYCPECGDEI